MSKSLTKEDRPFLAEALEYKQGSPDQLNTLGRPVSDKDGVNGEMSTPESVEVISQG